MGRSAGIAAGHVTVDHPIGFVHYLSSSHLIGCSGRSACTGHVTVEHPKGFCTLFLLLTFDWL